MTKIEKLRKILFLCDEIGDLFLDLFDNQISIWLEIQKGIERIKTLCLEEIKKEGGKELQLSKKRNDKWINIIP